MDQPAEELFYERQRRVEKELAVERGLTGKLIRELGERDVVIARLRETLSQIAVETVGKVRDSALSALEKAQK